VLLLFFETRRQQAAKEKRARAAKGEASSRSCLVVLIKLKEPLAAAKPQSDRPLDNLPINSNNKARIKPATMTPPSTTTFPSSHLPKMDRATSALSTGTTSATVWDDELGATSDQLFFVTSYRCVRWEATSEHSRNLPEFLGRGSEKACLPAYLLGCILRKAKVCHTTYAWLHFREKTRSSQLTSLLLSCFRRSHSLLYINSHFMQRL